MTDNQFDSFIRAKLHDHSAPVPAGLWDKVNPAKDDDRKAVIIPKKYRWGLTLLLLTGSCIGYLIFSSPSSSTEQPLSAAQAVIHTNEPTKNNHQNNTTEAAIAAPGPNRENEMSNQAPAGTNLLTDTKSLDNNLPVTTKIKTGSNDITNSTANKQTNQNNTEVKDLAVTNNKRKYSPDFIEAMPSFAGSAHQRKNSDFVINNRNLIPQSVLEEDEASALKYPLTFSQKLEQGNIVSLTRLNTDFSSLQRDQVSSAYSKKFKNIIVCPPAKTGNTDWFVELYASPDIAVKSIENISATPQYLQKKDSSESMRLGYTAGVRLVKPITDNLLVKTGLQYTQINEKFTYRTENEVRTITVISVRTIIRGPGDTLRVADTSTVQQTGFKNNTIKNRYRSFDIPVTVGYQFGNDNLQFGINAGVIFNISSWYQGVILDSSMSAVPISKGNNSIYKNNIGLGLYGGFSILKKMGEDTQLFFEPYFRYNLSGITNEQSSFKQRFSLGGLSIGLRYNLNRR